jgi:hypothetical protein
MKGMSWSVRTFIVLCFLAATCPAAPAATRPLPQPPPPRVVAPPPAPSEAPAETPPAPARTGGLVAVTTLASLGFADGLRFANLAGRRDVFVPVPQGGEVVPSELVLAFDDISAYEARRNVEVLVNDRSAAAIPLDGRGAGRVVRVPLAPAQPRDGFLKLSFVYAGAATQDRCIDARYVGDSLTIRPETAVELEVGFAGAPDVATTAALMPREVTLVVPRRALTAAEIAATLTVARALTASGRRVNLHYGTDGLADLLARADARRWSRGLVVVAPLADVSGQFDAPLATLAGAMPGFGTLAAVRIGGLPALVVSDAGAVRAARLIGSASLGATRGVAAASVREVAAVTGPADKVSFDQLGIAPVDAAVFGRADLTVAIDTRGLPAGTQPARLQLDVMVAPDGAGEKAVVSIFVNERLLASTVAATGEPTRFDLPFPDGLVGTAANLRAEVQRRSAQGDCKFEPQGYPAQILGSSAVSLTKAAAPVHDFSDLVAYWSNGVDVIVPPEAAARPERVLELLVHALAALSSEAAPIAVKFAAGADADAAAPFLWVGDAPPRGAATRVRFDHGRVVVADRNDRTLLDLGGFSSGALAQLVTVGTYPGLWIRPLAAEGALPTPPALRLDRGDVAFLDNTGVALAMSTERDTLVRIAYPDQVSWLTLAGQYRSWMIGGLWLLATIVFLVVLQMVFRRRAGAGE